MCNSRETYPAIILTGGNSNQTSEEFKIPGSSHNHTTSVKKVSKDSRSACLSTMNHLTSKYSE